MELDIIKALTTKDDKQACAFTNRIIQESQINNRWYKYFDEFASLLDYPKSLVRNRALTILAGIAKWDEENKFDAIINDYLVHISDEKPITARQCIKSLTQIAKAKPELTKKILSALKKADLEKYSDSMRPLIEKDILQVVEELSKE